MALFRTNTYCMIISILLLMTPACVLANPSHGTHQKPSKKTKQAEDQQPNMDGVVEVSFKIDAAGKIQIVDLISTSPQLSEYVLKKLAKIQINEQSAESGKVIKYRFTFKKQT